jgi:UDP-N-acetylmuramoyl-tripeptide--D-alanyl-D-alanine ligase
MPETWPWYAVTGAASAWVAWRRLLAYLRYFQQEGYEHLRFVRWVGWRPLTDPAVSLALVCAVLVTRAPRAALASFALIVVVGFVQPDPRRSGKIPLRLTARARRIFTLAFVLACAAWMGMALAMATLASRGAFLATAMLFLTMPVMLIASNVLLMPYERRVQAAFEGEARERLAAVRPFVIGITGSYGKSSSKAMLAHVLQFDGPTLAATGSINTLMGVTRHIREDLVGGHKYLVVEMGAFRTGSIRRLCELTPPSAALITAVGDMHLERFGSLDAIVRAKSELAEALPDGGLLVANADSPGALRIARAAAHRRVVLYGETSPEDVDARVRGITFSPQGTTFELQTRTGLHPCVTPLLGRPIILNLTGVFALAAAIGVPERVIVAAMRTLRPVANRLEVVEDRGITWIRDAYNSNQFGFRAALEVAAALPANRRFLVTPGVIELGEQQLPVNRALAREAAEVCDTTVIVSETNRQAFVEAHAGAGPDGRLAFAANRTEAFAWLRANAKAGDLVVLENDLPDLYERTDGLFWPASAGRDSKRVQPS